jgi:hypothetical protein
VQPEPFLIRIVPPVPKTAIQYGVPAVMLTADTGIVFQAAELRFVMVP